MCDLAAHERCFLDGLFFLPSFSYGPCEKERGSNCPMESDLGRRFALAIGQGSSTSAVRLSLLTRQSHRRQQSFFGTPSSCIPKGVSTSPRNSGIAKSVIALFILFVRWEKTASHCRHINRIKDCYSKFRSAQHFSTRGRRSTTTEVKGLAELSHDLSRFLRQRRS